MESYTSLKDITQKIERKKRQDGQKKGQSRTLWGPLLSQLYPSVSCHLHKNNVKYIFCPFMKSKIHVFSALFVYNVQKLFCFFK